jgi:hypothetical protein
MIETTTCTIMVYGSGRSNVLAYPLIKMLGPQSSRSYCEHIYSYQGGCGLQNHQMGTLFPARQLGFIPYQYSRVGRIKGS